jgi:predicted short-subunit dehydrogenase-like oxidoreductase (DUF2520 family)
MSKVRKRKAKKPTVSIVGSGRLGTALARALAAEGYQVEALVARSVGHARRAEKLVGHATEALSARQLNVLPLSKIILITVPDGEILKTATTISKVEASSRGRTVLHTSGALAAAEVLAPLAAVGFATGSLHPLVSVSDPRSGAQKLRGAYYCIEGDAVATRVARAIVKDLGGQAFHISAEDKPLYHAAAVMASGHVTALVDLATDLLVQCGLDKKTARRVLLPLLESTVTNLSVSEAATALTGTFARGDLDTVKRHLRALANKRSAAALAAYKLLGRHSLSLAQQRIDSRTRKQILLELE